jgi:hypothetical protein
MRRPSSSGPAVRERADDLQLDQLAAGALGFVLGKIDQSDALFELSVVTVNGSARAVC